jgi:hypothetical protein
MIEQKFSDVASDRYENPRRHPAPDAPRQVIDRDKSGKNSKRSPYALYVMMRQNIHDIFDGILRTDGATYTCNDRNYHQAMSKLMVPNGIQNEAYGPLFERGRICRGCYFQAILLNNFGKQDEGQWCFSRLPYLVPH